MTKPALRSRLASFVRRIARDPGVETHRTVIVQASADEVYALWRDLDNLPCFMKHVHTISVYDPRLSQWVVGEGPVTLGWTSEITEDDPGRRIAWRSLPGSDLDHDGWIDLHPLPAGRGTRVDVVLRYRPPGGRLVSVVAGAWLRRFTGAQLGAELHRMQQLVETGEVATGARRRQDARPHELASDTVHPAARRPSARMEG